jgi:hypothetical protein
MDVSGQFHALAHLPQVKSSQYTLAKRLDGPQSHSEHGSKKK